MFKSILQASIAVMFLAAFLSSPQSVSAQVAPTNAATIAGSVTDSSGRPIAAAKVTLSGPQSASTQTDAQGQFVFVGVPFGTYQLTTAAAKLGTATRTLTVEGDINVAIQYEPPASGLKVIATVSTRANARFNVTAASVTQVVPQEKAFEGETSWRKIIEQIPGITQGGLGKGFSTLGGWPDAPLSPVLISINGALPYETATLLDGMPLVGSTFGGNGFGFGTDLSGYPLNAFGVADIVRGPGAASPSIVNSIGGSFVLHAPSTVGSNRYEFSVSSDPYGGWVVNGLAALRWNKLSTVVTYGFNDSPGPLNQTGIPAHVFSVGTSGGAPYTINGQYVLCTGTCATTNLVSPNYASASSPIYGYQGGLLIGGVPQISAWTQHGGSAALIYSVSPAANAEVFYAGQIVDQPASYQNFTFNFTPPAGYAGPVPAGINHFQGSGFLLGPGYSIQASSLLEEKITAQLGRGLLRIAALQNRSYQNQDFTVPSNGPFSAQLFGGASLCSTTPCTAANATPTVFNGGTYTISYPKLDFHTPGIGVSRDVLMSYETLIGDYFHVGASYVKSYYNDSNPNITEVVGPPVNLNVSATTPDALSEGTNEFRLFLGGNPSSKTTLDLSMYLANVNYHVGAAVANPVYTDSFSSYAAPRLGFVWRPTPPLAFRASTGGGFAAIPLPILVGGNGTPTLNSAAGVYTQTLTATNLQPEKSFGFDVGADLKLQGGTLVSFDVYRTNLFGQLYRTTTMTGNFNGLPLLTTQYGNLGQSRYEGVLLDIRHDVARGLFWSFSGGLTRGYVVSLPAGFYNTATGTCNVTTGANCQNVQVIPGINFDGEFTSFSQSQAIIPYAQALGTLGYRWKDQGRVDVVGTYYGNNNPYIRPAFVEVDGHLSYPLSKNIALVATLRNLTNIYGASVTPFDPSVLTGAPTITGLPYVLYGQQYGPRALIVTSQFRF